MSNLERDPAGLVCEGTADGTAASGRTVTTDASPVVAQWQAEVVDGADADGRFGRVAFPARRCRHRCCRTSAASPTLKRTGSGARLLDRGS